MTVLCLGSIDIFRLTNDEKLEYFNEALILICVYHFLCFTDFVDILVREYVGISLVFFSIFNVSINLLVLLIATFKRILFVQKKLRYKYRVWKIKRKNKAKKVLQMEKLNELVSSRNLTKEKIEEIM